MRKIRGNVVGTNMSVDRIAERIGSDVYNVNASGDKIDDTFANVKDAFLSGKVVTLTETDDEGFVWRYVCTGYFEDTAIVRETLYFTSTLYDTVKNAELHRYFEDETIVVWNPCLTFNMRLDTKAYNVNLINDGTAIDDTFENVKNAFLSGKVVTLTENTDFGVNKYVCFNQTFIDWGEAVSTDNDVLQFACVLTGNVVTVTIIADENGNIDDIQKHTDTFGITTDKTLSQSGKAADAKAVGDKIAEVSAEAVVAVNESLAKKLNKYSGTGSTMFYGVNAQGEQYMHSGAISAAAYTAALRGAGGTLNVGTPTADANATNKKYVDDLVSKFKPKVDYNFAPDPTNEGDYVGQIWQHMGLSQVSPGEYEEYTVGLYMYGGRDTIGEHIWIKLL